MTSIHRSCAHDRSGRMGRRRSARPGRGTLLSAFVAAVLMAGVPAPASAQDVVIVNADAMGADCVGGDQTTVDVPSDDQISVGTSLHAQVEIVGSYCGFLGGGGDHVVAKADVEVEGAKLKAFASVVNDQFGNPGFPASKDLFASSLAHLETLIRLQTPGVSSGGPGVLKLLVRLSGFVGPNLDCGLIDELPQLTPPCAEGVFIAHGVITDGRTGEQATPGPLGTAELSINATNFTFTDSRRLLFVTVPLMTISEIPRVLAAPLALNLRAEVHGRGLVSLHDTATLYVELPEGATYLGNSGGNLGTSRSDFVVQAGQAIPDPAGSLAISPASGVIAPGQAFDLVLVLQTGGQGVVGAAATFDGVDITAPLGACLAAHAGALALGTPGVVLRCPGLTGSLFGPGTHTLAVTLQMSGGGTLTDSAVWEVPGAGPPAPSPRLAVSPGSGPLAQGQGVDLVLFADLAGRGIVGGQITLDEQDVTPTLAGCFVATALPTGQLVARCPGLVNGLLGLGSHVLHVRLDLSDGSTVERSAVWQVLAAAGS